MENKIIDGFTVGEYVGRGSFGIVYKAVKDGTTYAIKFIDLKHIASAYDDTKRLDREIEALKRVKSKHTVEYVADGYYTDNHIDYKYIVMEFVSGETLEKVLARDKSPWSIEKTTDFIDELLNALDVIHQNNIIHRDLKLDNIAICDDGRIKVIDYGLSKIIDFSTLTKSGTVIGAPYFMSPEQILDGKNITYVSDYYAIGSILFLLLTGNFLFESVSEQEVTYKTVNVRPPLPSSLNSKIPTNVESTVLRLLSKQAYERYKSTEEIMQALREKTPSGQQAGPALVKFYPRLMNGDTTIIDTLLRTTDLDGVDFPIHEHKRSVKLIKLLRDKSDKMDFIADPGTNRMVYTGFRKTASLKALTYAPEEYHPYEPEDFDDPTKVRDFVKNVIDLQVASGCTILTAPYFYFDSATDDWFKLNIQLLRVSHDYVSTEYSGYPLSAAICTQAETLTRRKEQKLIIDGYANNSFEYLQLFVDCIKESTNDAQLYNYIQTALAIKQFNKAKLIACRVPAVGLGLLTIGFDAITSGLAVLDTFDKSIIEKDYEMALMPIKRYFPDLLMAVTVKAPSGVVKDIQSYEETIKSDYPQYTINFSSIVPDELKAGLSEGNMVPKLEFLFAREAEIGEINAAAPDQRRNNFIQRIDKSVELRKALSRKGIKLSAAGATDGLKTWKDVLQKF